MNLSNLGFTEERGLVLVSSPRFANNSEMLFVSEAKKLNIDAVFFRRYFEESKTSSTFSEPAVCILYRDSDFFDSEEHLELHRALWSISKVEVYMIVGQNFIEIINARKPAQVVSKGSLSIKDLILASSNQIRQFNDHRFFAHLFASGTFWEQHDFEGQLEEKNSPYYYLLDYLMLVRKDFLNEKSLKLDPSTTDKLLVICILIKFLEEIKDDNGKHTLRNIYKKYRVNSFADALDKGICITILKELSTEFNGQIFDQLTSKERAKVEGTNLKLLADFLRADINLRNQQLFLWEQYSFKHLPTEVVSAIYENFIQADSFRQRGAAEKGVVYTPIHLVNFLIDEMMPLNKPELFNDEQFRVLDPACGSGIFLVAAYKRMLQWWAINNRSTDGEIKFPKSKIAQRILENNIFGIDINETATLVSIFSLTIAILDKLTPQEIWNNFKFEDLTQNIRASDFFKWSYQQDEKEKYFDLVIGNPPFNPSSGVSKKNAVKDEHLQAFRIKSSDIPDNNFALKFLEGAYYFGKDVCMVIPANVLLYNTGSQKYRERLFTNLQLRKIYDFTHLRRELFHRSADIPIVAVISNALSRSKKMIEHVVVKRMISSEKKLRFEVDHYDHHFVRLDFAINVRTQFIWKTNLLGGGRLFHFIYRLSLLPTLDDYISQQKNWNFSLGYIIGNNSQRNTASYITNQDTIVEITDEGIVEVATEKSKYFEATRDEELYKPPFILVKAVVGYDHLPIFLIERYKKKYLTFKRAYYGISAPEEDLSKLRKVFKNVKKTYSKLYQFYILCKSASTLVKQETNINKEDIAKLPYPTDQHIELSETENILLNDVLTYNIHLGKSISKNGAGNQLIAYASEQDYMAYGVIFCNVLNSIYSTVDKSWQVGKIERAPAFTIYQFGFGLNNSLQKLYLNVDSIDIDALLYDKISNHGAVFTRNIKVYKHADNCDCVFFIKPNSKRYWLQSVALRDADETYVELKKQGY